MTLKRWSANCTMACFFLAGGIEYSVIFPTMWDYVRQKDGEEWLYGLSLAAFSISNLITAPLYGLLFDRTHQTKFIVLFANLFEIGGNFMYFSATTKYMILGSRFIVGLGAGAGATIFGDLARTTKRKSRTAVFSVFMGMRQIGLVIGPAFNLFLNKCKFKVGPFPVNNLTAPGAFMVLVWLVVELVFVLFFFTLPTIDESPPPNLSASEVEVPHGSINKPHNSKDVNSASNETTPLLTHRSPPNIASSKSSSRKMNTDKRNIWYSSGLWRIWELMREETVVLLAVLFTTMFNQTAIEAMCVPMAEKLLGWGEQATSIFYSIAGAVIIVAFVIVTLLSRCVEDRWQIIVGLLCELFGYAWFIALVGQATSETPWILWRFVVGSFFCIFGLPFFMVTSAALYSKMLPISIQGFGQGIRRSILSVAAILGPLWAGGSVAFSNYYVLFGVLCGLLVFTLALIILSFSQLRSPQ